MSCQDHGIHALVRHVGMRDCASSMAHSLMSEQFQG